MPLVVHTVTPPPLEQRRARDADFPGEGKSSRYTLPTELESSSPVGYRTRPHFTQEEALQALQLLSLERPEEFSPPVEPVTEQELFEEASLGLLSSRQSTNYRGHKQVTLGPSDSRALLPLLQQLQDLDAEPLEGAEYTHLVFSRQYRTPFTLLLTFVGHKPLLNLLTVPWRAWQKWLGADDIPTIGYLQHLHLGILADAMERAAVIASTGRRAAQVLQGPFTSPERRRKNQKVIRQIEDLAGLRAEERRAGWQLSIVTQVGSLREPLPLKQSLCRKLGAALMAFRSERIQPGVNQEEKAPTPYQTRQDMDVSEDFTVQAGRAAYNAFTHWMGCDRDQAKQVMLMNRIDVLHPGGKEQLRAIRRQLNDVTDRLIRDFPLWVDLPTGRMMTRNANRGRKAFALAGQRIYVGGLDRALVSAMGLDWLHAVRAAGSAAARSALYCELMGCVEVPEGCDLLAGICLMAGPVNQNDIGKQFYGYEDLLAGSHPDRDPTSLLVWVFKAKTVADPVGNEEQLLSAKRKGALVDLRPGPHEVLDLRVQDRRKPMRSEDRRRNAERAFGDQDNFARNPEGKDIPGNIGSAWPADWAGQHPWEGERS